MTKDDRIAELEEEVRQLRELLCPGGHYVWVFGFRQRNVLAALHAARGRAVSMERLLTAAWPDVEISPTTARVIIGDLRRKLKPKGIRILTGSPLSYRIAPRSLRILDAMRV